MFRPGDKKPETSGRKKGTPNKLTVSARQRLEDLGCDPLEGMALIAMNEGNSPELRGKMYAEIAQYVYPKLKGIDHTFGGSGTLNVNNTSGTELLTGRIASLATRGRVAPSDSGTERGSS